MYTTHTRDSTTAASSPPQCISPTRTNSSWVALHWRCLITRLGEYVECKFYPWRLLSPNLLFFVIIISPNLRATCWLPRDLFLSTHGDRSHEENSTEYKICWSDCEYMVFMCISTLCTFLFSGYLDSPWSGLVAVFWPLIFVLCGRQKPCLSLFIWYGRQKPFSNEIGSAPAFHIKKRKTMLILGSLR